MLKDFHGITAKNVWVTLQSHDEQFIRRKITGYMISLSKNQSKGLSEETFNGKKLQGLLAKYYWVNQK